MKFFILFLFIKSEHLQMIQNRMKLNLKIKEFIGTQQKSVYLQIMYF